MASTAGKQPITRADLERRFGGFQAQLQGKVEERKVTLTTVAGVGATVLLLVVFLLGRRAGKRKRTLIEIRRV